MDKKDIPGREQSKDCTEGPEGRGWRYEMSLRTPREPEQESRVGVGGGGQSEGWSGTGLHQKRSGFPGRPNSQGVLDREAVERLGSGSPGRRSKSVTYFQHVGFSPTSGNSLAAAGCRSHLTLLTQRWHHIPQVKGSVPQDQTSPPNFPTCGHLAQVTCAPD